MSDWICGFSMRMRTAPVPLLFIEIQMVAVVMSSNRTWLHMIEQVFRMNWYWYWILVAV